MLRLADGSAGFKFANGRKSLASGNLLLRRLILRITLPVALYLQYVSCDNLNFLERQRMVEGKA
jgi:hypothetical protein